MDIHFATKRELPRVVELINRTNQFNISGSRTSLPQVTGWSESPNHHILVAHAGDKFGDMGIVSALVAGIKPDAISVNAWVLSCRVFGYGIEIAMLNSLRRLSTRLEIPAMEGRIVETSNNQPCREVFARSGFNERNGVWLSDANAMTSDPGWLEVTASGYLDHWPIPEAAAG